MSAAAGQTDSLGTLSGVARLSDYVQMSRPRILVMSAVAVLAGYVLASPVIDWMRAVTAVFGTLCLVAASSVLNQVWESSRDAQDEADDRATDCQWPCESFRGFDLWCCFSGDWWGGAVAVGQPTDQCGVSADDAVLCAAVYSVEALFGSLHNCWCGAWCHATGAWLVCGRGCSGG